MRAFIILFAFLVGICSISTAQKVAADKLPAAVSASFKTKYPRVEKASWMMADRNQYGASFKVDKDKFFAIFDKDGNWIQTENSIDDTKLPRESIQAITKQFPGFDMVDMQKVESQEYGVQFKITIEKKDKGFDLIVSDKGEIIKKTAVVEGGD